MSRYSTAGTTMAALLADTVGFREYGETAVHPVTLLFWLSMVGMVLFSSRSRAVLGVILVCVFIPHVQRVVIAGADFTMLRLLMLFAWARIIWRREYEGFTPGKIDIVVAAWATSAAVIQILRVGPSGMALALGVAFDRLAVYFFVRLLVRRREAVFLLTRQFAWVAIGLGLFMLYEWVTLHNPFSILGDISPMPQIRKGRIRCQACFPHPILAGTFGAVLLPIFIGAFRGRKVPARIGRSKDARQHPIRAETFGAVPPPIFIGAFRGRKGERTLFGSAIVFATIIVAASGSSGALLTWLVALFGWGLWHVRRHMRMMLLAATGMLVVIHFARAKPVWSLIGKMSNLTGGTGYHRVRLIDAFINNFSGWALLGTSGTAHWGWGLQDVTSQYVGEGISGGFLTFTLFIVLLHVCFSRLRLTRMLYEGLGGPKSLWTLLAWGFSVSLACHCVSFTSVAYFGQMRGFWVLFLGSIPALAQVRPRVRRRRPATARPPRPSEVKPAPQVARPVA